MAKEYRRADRDQLRLFPPGMRNLPGRDHPARLVITAAEDHLDTSAFHAGRGTGAAGAAGYDPDTLVTLLARAYANRVTSSRRTGQLCGTDAAFMAIRGAGQAPGHLKGRPGPARNITGPDSRLMPARGGGFIQGHNAQNLTSEDGLIIATGVTGDTTGTASFEPMMTAGQDAAALITARRPRQDTTSHDTGHDAGSHDTGHDAGSHDAGGQDAGGQDTGGHDAGADGIGLVLCDCGYCSEANLTAPGPDRLIAVGKRRNLEKAARGGRKAGRENTGPATRAMAGHLATPGGIAACRQRGHIAGTPHGHIKHNMGFRQLTMRGKAKAKPEWTFVSAVHNIFKAISTGHLTAAALAALAS